MPRLLPAFLFACAVLASRAGAVETVLAGGGTITVSLSADLAARREEILPWIRRAADAVAGYYGHFPVPALHLEVLSRPGEPVNSGREFDGRFIRIGLNPGAAAADLRQDWMLTHEMFHLGFPSLDRRYHYLEEGLSDYLEPLARARAGQTPPTQPWKDFIEGMPKGLPRPGDAGLDGTRGWGRTYWGGCFFWLLADLDIRQRTGNAKSLDDAIRAIVAAGGTGGSDWTLERMMRVGDAAAGTDSIAKTHLLLGSRAVDPDLDGVWRRLGVREEGGKVSFDDAAPLAAIRRAMTAGSR